MAVENKTLGTVDFMGSNVLQLLPAAVYTCDKDGRITFFNEAAAQLWGSRPELNSDYIRFCAFFKVWAMDGTFLRPEETPMSIALQTGQSFRNVEAQVERPDGSRFYVNVNIDPILDSNNTVIGAVNIIQDISNQKKTELALKESEERYRELVASLEENMVAKAHDLQRKNEELKKSEDRYHRMIDEVEDYAIILLDRNGIIQNWNKGAENIKKYKEEEIVGKSFDVFYQEEDRQNGLPMKLINEAREKGKATHEGWRVRKDGNRFWGSILNHPPCTMTIIISLVSAR